MMRGTCINKGVEHTLNIYKTYTTYNKTGSILKIEPFFFMFFNPLNDCL